MTTCDPSPGAPSTCPVGYHCTPDGKCDALCTPMGNECGDGFTCTSDGQCIPVGQCTGVQCQVVDCAGMGQPSTTISGTVFAPNGTLPLYGVTVYVPNSDPGPLPAGAQCSRCSDNLPGDPITRATTDEAGKFTLTDVPAGMGVKLVIASGKWRRIVTLPPVNQCTDNPLPAAMTSLPKNASEGDMPKIAITTGAADSLECLIRKMGVADTEITNSSGSGHVHLYAGNGVSKFVSGWPGGSSQSFASATNFWNNSANLMPYDAVILSCEGGQNPNTKPQAALDAMKAYADIGGRVFASHWHNIWIAGAGNSGGNQKIPSWVAVSTWNYGNDPGNGTIDTIDEANNPKGSSFATWMQNVGGSTTRDQIAIVDGTAKQTCNAVDVSKGERWVFLNQGSTQRTQNFQFTTPQEMPSDQRCGKVVFSDMHVSGGPQNGDYPTSCGTSTTLSPQEKALAFMLFDLSSCVGTLF